MDLFGDHDTQTICDQSQQFQWSDSSIVTQAPIARKANVYRVDTLKQLAIDLGRPNGDRTICPGPGSDDGTTPAGPAGDPSSSLARRFICDIETSQRPAIIFTGGAENHPALFCPAVYGNALLTGPSVKSILRLLDPQELQFWFRRDGIETPPTIFSTDALVDLKSGQHDRWLRKNIRSGGGLQIAPWSAAEPVRFEKGDYLQKRIDGPTVSGCFIAARSGGGATKSVLLGCCTQHHHPMQDKFLYHGSYGVTPLEDATRNSIAQIGSRIADRFDLVGVFGIDFIVSSQGIYLLDINPRIPASAEIIEQTYATVDSDFTIVGAHLGACLRSQVPDREYIGRVLKLHRKVFSKRIVYWDRDFRLLIDGELMHPFLQCGDFTDLPPVGSVVSPGQPLLTQHTAASNVRQLPAMDREKNAQLQQIIQTAIDGRRLSKT